MQLKNTGIINSFRKNDIFRIAAAEMSGSDNLVFLAKIEWQLNK